MPHRALPFLIAATSFAAAGAAQAQSPDVSDWGHYGGDAFGQRYSSLAEIDRHNVGKLQVAWTFRTGELGAGFARADRLAFQATPVLAFGSLLLSTPTNIVYALDPATSKVRWRYDPRIDRQRPYAEASSRGVTPWENQDLKARGPCVQRIFLGTLDARLIALDAGTGQPCASFGKGGAVDALEGLSVRDPDDYPIVSPPVVSGDTVMISFSAGTVRGYDAITGAPRWSSITEPVHAPMSADLDHNLLFVPAGSSLLALDAGTGKLSWRRELVHHDLWHFELAAQPALIDLEPRGIPASTVLQATPNGMLFLFDRVNGRPVVPIVEQRVPQREIAGPPLSPTQPFPITPLLVAQRPPDSANAWGITFWDRAQCRRLFRKYRNDGPFTPPEARGTLLWPGPLGGINWGGVAFDARRQRVFAAVNHLPSVVYPDGTHKPLVSAFGFPCTAPPWGSLVSVDLRDNQIVWQVPLGSTEGLGPWFAPTRDFGTPGRGGPIATAGDIVFVGAAMDGYFRAFDLETGRELWKHRLPGGGQATPMTYRAGRNHRQYVVICAGGDATLDTPQGDYVVAFSLRDGK